MDKDIYFMKKAILEAKKAEKIDEVPIGAVIVQNDKIIARAHNLKEIKKQAINHAEILCIQRASKKLDRWRLSDCTIYVTLEPCSMCAGALLQSRIQRIVFGAYDLKGGALGSSFNLFEQKNLNHHPEIVSGVLLEENSSMLSNYFKSKRSNKI